MTLYPYFRYYEFKPDLSGLITVGAKKFFLVGFILILLTAIPLTMFLLQKQQETRSKAAPSTTLSFTPTSSPSSPIQKNVNDTIDLHVVMNPGSNLVTYVKLIMTYDSTKFSTAGAGFAPNVQSFPAVLSPVTYQPGKVSIELSIGTNSTGVIQSTTEVGVLTLQAINANTATSPSVAFDSQTLILASCLNPQDPSSCPDNEATNVLSTSNPAFISVAGTPVPPTAAPTAPPPTPGPTTAATAPTCTTLTFDRNPAGTAPFAIAITATGDANPGQGVINKVTFNFGDGPTVDVTQNGGIGSNHASVQMAHTYNNVGTYKAYATFTGSNNTISDISQCSLTITVSPAPTVGPGTPTPTPFPTATVSATPTPLILPTSTPTPLVIQPTTKPSGPGDTFVKLGSVGAVLSIVGAILFFAL